MSPDRTDERPSSVDDSPISHCISPGPGERGARDSDVHLEEMLYSVCWLFCCTSAKCGLSQRPLWESWRGY